MRLVTKEHRGWHDFDGILTLSPTSKSSPGDDPIDYNTLGTLIALMLELKKRDGLARICEFETPRGTVETPALMPVINPNQVLISASEMSSKFGTQIVITNAYIIFKNPNLRERALGQGLHSLLGFDGPIMTDSGAFQSHVYGDVDVSNKEILAFQSSIGSDISTILDVFSEPFESEEVARGKMEETLRRAEEATKLKENGFLAGAVQGSTYPEMREECASRLSGMGFEVHALGGMVPLLENYRFQDVVNLILASKRGLDPSKPVHLFGAGHPMIFALIALLGCDLFDSSSYAKYAKSGRMMFPFGTRRVSDLTRNFCGCPACRSTSMEEMAKDERKIAEHNLYVSFQELSRVKQAIEEGTIWELAETRCRSHPSLLSALRKLKEHNPYLERFEPASRRAAFFFTGQESLDRPVIWRLNRRILERYKPREADLLIELPESNKPFSMAQKEDVHLLKSSLNALLVVNSAIGQIPIELDEIYPVAQSLIPANVSGEELREKRKEEFDCTFNIAKRVHWKGKETLEILEDFLEKRSYDLDRERIEAVADYQFGKGCGKLFTEGSLKMVKSKITGKIRNVLLGGKHVLSMRAHDGLFTLKLDGGRILHSFLSSPKLRVVVSQESAKFNREGRNVFAGFVIECDEDLRPGDECLVVEEQDELVAVGRTTMNREEMLAFKKGVAVHVREGVG